MHELRFPDLDDDLFPACTVEHVGITHTDEYGVTYICDLIDGLGYGWVHLGRPEPGPDPRRE